MSYSLYDAVLGAVNLRQVISSAYRANGTVIPGYQSAGLAPSQLYGGRINPVFVLSSGDLATVLSSIDPALGLSISTGIVVPLRQAADQSTYLAGANHFSKTCTNGLAVVDQVSAQDGPQSIATANLTLHCRSADGLDPVTPATGQSLIAQAFVAQFGFGPAVVTPTGAGAVTPDITGWTVSTGIQVIKEFQGGLPAPQRVYIRRHPPTIDLQFRDADKLATFTASYKGLTAVDVYARRYADGETFEDDVDLLHGKFSFATGITETQDLTAQDNQSAVATLRLHGKALTWSPTNAIP